MVQIASSLGVGTVFASWLIFLLSLGVGFSVSTILFGTTVIIIMISVLYSRPSVQAKLILSVGKWEGGLLLLGTGAFLALYFGLSLWQTSDGATWYAANYTDFPYHLAQVNSFATQDKFPPDHPQAAGCLMAYHFMVNFHSACLLKLSMPLLWSAHLPNVLYAFALGILLAAFYLEFCTSKMASGFAVLLFLFNKEAIANVIAFFLGKNPGEYSFSFAERPWHALRSIALFPFFNFDDPIINLFHPQRPMLFGFGIALTCFMLLRGVLLTAQPRTIRLPLMTGIILGMMPLFHMPSYIVIIASGAFALLLRKRFRDLCYFAIPAIVLALPQLLYLAFTPKTPGYSAFEIHMQIPTIFGGQGFWRIAERPLFWLWVGGTSFWIGLAGWMLWFVNRLKERNNSENKEVTHKGGYTYASDLLVGSAVFFLVVNIYRFSPNWGDSNKFFSYLMLFLCVFGGNLIAQAWGRNLLRPVVLAVLGLGCVLPYAAELQQHFGQGIRSLLFSKDKTAAGQLMFSADDWACAQWIRGNTPEKAVFLTSDSIVHFLPALTGRRSFMGAYTRENGVGGDERRTAAETMFHTGSADLMRKWGVDYVLVGPQEGKMSPSEQKLEQLQKIYDVVGRSGRYRVLRVKTGAKRRISPNEDECIQGGVSFQPYSLPQGAIGLGLLHPEIANRSHPKVDVLTQEDAAYSWGDNIGFAEALTIHGNIKASIRIPLSQGVFLSYLAVPSVSEHSSAFYFTAGTDNGVTNKWGPISPGECRLVSMVLSNVTDLTLSLDFSETQDDFPVGIWGAPMIVNAYGVFSQTGAVDSLPALPLRIHKVYLSELTAVNARQDCGELIADMNFDHTDKIRIRGTVFLKGITTHANSEVVYRLNGEFLAFTSFVGVEDPEAEGPASVTFQVLVDGQVAYDSKKLTGTSPPEFVSVDVRGAQTLTLVVGDAGDGITCDHACWADAHLVKAISDGLNDGKEEGP